MGKKEKDKSKKNNEIREMIREEIESVLRNALINAQFAFNPTTEEVTTKNTTQVANNQNLTEEQSDTKFDVPSEEKP